ncbi:MAG: NAD(P)H-hydrate dehydratase [Candidatus Aenigmatarchaeota archaeon]
MITIDYSILKEVYHERPEWSHKGDFGKVLIIGGSKIYTGSPALVAYGALAALRAGCDIVMIAAPERPADIIAKFSPNLITTPFEGDYFTSKHLKKVLELSKNYDAIAIGPGLGIEKETQKFVIKFIEEIKKPCVVDADALKAIEKRKLSKNFVLTPHAYEFYFITGERPKYDLTTRAEMVRRNAKKFGATILLKGAIDIISDGEKIAINRTGNPYMSVGGTGDVLTGICASLLAQGVSPFKSACAAAYINGRAGDLAAKEKRPLLATDIIDKIPEVLKDVLPLPKEKEAETKE